MKIITQHRRASDNPTHEVLTAGSTGASALPGSLDVLVVGAGIVGCACADELASADLSVAVLEADTVGSGATAAGMGHIVVMDDSPAQLALTRYSQLLWDELVAAQPAEHEYTRCGTIWVAADADELQEATQKQETFNAEGIPAQLLDPKSLAEHEPNLRAGLAGGLLVPGDSVVYPPRSAAALMQQAQNRGATLLSGRITDLIDGGVRLSNGQIIQARHIVIANGARAVDLLPDIPLRPKKGHLAITDRTPGFLRHQLVELGYVKSAHATSGDSVAFNVQPRATGQVLIGSSRQFDQSTNTVDAQLLARMLRHACSYMPALAHLSCIRVWTGLRAATPDGLPLIGPHPYLRGLWLATGHEGLGITTALATAKLLAAHILHRPSPLPLEPYVPARLWPHHQGPIHIAQHPIGAGSAGAPNG